MVNVPSFAVPYIKAASAGTGLSFNLVACQVNAESGFNANAISPAGAEGPYQFLPSTFRSVASGSPFNWHDSTIAYIVYMTQLLKEFRYNVRDALAAYNAGPGNIGAGFGYADGIILCAGNAIVISALGGAQVPGGIAAPQAKGSGDDWSGTIRQSAGWFNYIGGVAMGYARGIERL